MHERGRFVFGETERVEVVRPLSIVEPDGVALDGGKPMSDDEAIALALDLLLAAGADDAAEAARNALAFAGEASDA